MSLSIPQFFAPVQPIFGYTEPVKSTLVDTIDTLFPAIVNLGSINSTTGQVFEGSDPLEQVGWSIDVVKNFDTKESALLLGSTTKSYAVRFGQNSSQLVVTGVKGIQDQSNPVSGDKASSSGAVIIGAPLESCAYVVFTDKVPEKNFNVKTLNGKNGLSVCDASQLEGLGQAVSICDVNRDGVGDFIIGAPGLALRTDIFGKVYVIFGIKDQDHEWPAHFNVTTLNGANGYVLTGTMANDYFGTSLACASDGTLVIGSPGHNSYTGAVHVHSEGKSFTIFGEFVDDAIGQVVTTLDVNGDGLTDIGFGSNLNNKAYVVFGKEVQANFTIGELDGTNGFIFVGTNNDPEGATGFACTLGSGAINSDSIDDFFSGACVASPGNINAAGQSYVLYGHTGSWNKTIYADNLDGTNGFTINGAAPGDLSGSSIAGIGDFNSDGAADFAVGAPGGGKKQAGKVYVLYGKKREIRTTSPEKLHPIGTIVGPILAALGAAGLAGLGLVAFDRYKKIKRERQQPDEGTPLVDV